MLNVCKDKNQYDELNEFEKIKYQIYCANNEFNNASDELQIKAAVFRLCELEARRDLILKRLKGAEE